MRRRLFVLRGSRKFDSRLDEERDKESKNNLLNRCATVVGRVCRNVHQSREVRPGSCCIAHGVAAFVCAAHRGCAAAMTIRGWSCVLVCLFFFPHSLSLPFLLRDNNSKTTLQSKVAFYRSVNQLHRTQRALWLSTITDVSNKDRLLLLLHLRPHNFFSCFPCMIIAEVL